MARSLFVQSPDDALRHVNLLAKGLKQAAIAGSAGAAACGALGFMLNRFTLVHQSGSSVVLPVHEISRIVLAAWTLAIAMLVFSTLYFIAGWGLSRQKEWSRFAAAATFLLKIVLCGWFGHTSLRAALFFLLIAAWDIYGLWVLLAKETGQLLISPEPGRTAVKPANLAT